ncbi:Hypothetical predicted protein [Lecanosticta acicola]|uniref:Large ribosomal subunit protein mL54 n=1 Tax=Lecanosticta acicola TaxID=111012 RepID=A0AAI8Z4T4_9PEZI|nr:Hypothetical predicted protein [Lecanosticta acicola]
MICQRCMRRLGRPIAPPRISNVSCQFSQIAHQRAQAVTAHSTTATNPRPNDKPAATSKSAAQPFSTPETPSPHNLDLPIDTKRQSKAPVKIQSSVPAGTVLKGLNFMKNKEDPVALDDKEYPDWLWSALEKSKPEATEGGAEGDLFSKSKKQRRIAAKALRKQQLLNPESLAPKVPLYEQTIDLPAGDGSVTGAKDARQARQELTKAMREKRRSKIKEANFLKEMS